MRRLRVRRPPRRQGIPHLSAPRALVHAEDILGGVSYRYHFSLFPFLDVCGSRRRLFVASVGFAANRGFWGQWVVGTLGNMGVL